MLEPAGESVGVGECGDGVFNRGLFAQGGFTFAMSVAGVGVLLKKSVKYLAASLVSVYFN